MNMSTDFVCVADFPDDGVEEGEDIILPSGYNAACAIVNIMEDAGMIVSFPALDHEHGWEFFVKKGAREYWILITDLREEMLIQTEEVSPFLTRLFEVKGSYAEFLLEMHDLLSNDKRFISVNWMS